MSLLSPALLAWFVAVAGFTMAVVPLVRGHGQWIPASVIGTTPTAVLFSCFALFAAHWYISGRLRAPIRKVLTVAVIVLPMVALMGAISGPSSIGSRFGGSYGVLFATLTASLPAWISVSIYGVVTFFGLLLAARMLLMPPPVRGDVFETLTQNAKRAGESRLGVSAETSPTARSAAKPIAASIEDDSPLFGCIQGEEDSGRSTSASMTSLPEIDEAPPQAADPPHFTIASPPRLDQPELEVDDDSDLRVDDPVEEASHARLEMAAFFESPMAESEALALGSDAAGPILAEADVMSESAAIVDEPSSAVFEEVIEEVVHATTSKPVREDTPSTRIIIASPLVVQATAPESTFDEHAALQAAVSEPAFSAPIVESHPPASCVVESTPMIESLFGEPASPSEPLRKARRRMERGDWASWEDTPTRARKPIQEVTPIVSSTGEIPPSLEVHSEGLSYNSEASETVPSELTGPSPESITEVESKDDGTLIESAATPLLAVSTPMERDDEFLAYDDEEEEEESDDEPVATQASTPVVSELGFDFEAEHLGRALELAEQAGYASIGLFQSEMKVPFTTAAMIIERLVADGFIGPLGPSGRRTVLTLGESGEASAEA